MPFAVRMLKDKFKSFLIYSLSAVGLLEMYVVLFPSISQQSDKIDQMMKSFPPEFFKAMNMDPSSLSFSTMESYLSTEYMSFLWPILAIIFAISLANYIAVREVDSRTIETLLSLPATRTKIFIERYFAGSVLLVIFTAISLFSAVPLSLAHGADFVAENYLTATIGSIFFILAVYSLAVFVSVIFSEKGKSTMISGGILILMYAINVIAGLKESLVNIKYASFFNYFNGPELLNKNTYPEWALFALGVASLALAIAALVRFNRRDLSV